jgi:hypothetical protein
LVFTVLPLVLRGKETQILMLKYISAFVRRLYGDEPMTIYTWSERCAKISTPDQIIAAGMIESFAKLDEFEDWKQGYDHVKGRDKSAPYFYLQLVNEKKDFKLSYCHGYGSHTDFSKCFSFEINGCSFDTATGQEVLKKYSEVASKHEAVKAAAAKAKKDMEDNEKKWNLVESSLRLKRNEFGALVPITPVE